MKKLDKSLRIIPALFTAVMALASCFDLPQSGKTGSMQISIGEKFLDDTRANMPDVNDFNLEVADSKGSIIYNGPYRDSPGLIEVPPGNYTISVLSCNRGGPAFDQPQYGDTQIVVVPSGQCVAVQMICSQLNCGLKLSVRDSFKNAFPQGKLLLKSGADELNFDYEEKRVAYFNPGSVSLLMENDGSRETLFSHVLEARQMLAVNLSAMGTESGAGINLQLDTARVWTSEDFCYGGGGEDIGDALEVMEARGRAGQQGVWVFGYIVGSFNSSSGPSFSAPFSKNTNIAIASRPGSTDKGLCLSVELKSGAIRDAVNLVSNPSNLGRGIYLKGDIVEAYYGIPGLKNVTEYQWK